MKKITKMSKEVFYIVTTLVAVVVSLIAYLWKQKDSAYSDFEEKLDKILEAVNLTKMDITSIKKDNQYIIKENAELKAKFDLIKKHLELLQEDVIILKEFKKNLKA